jgi:hypothetical protein
MERKTMAAIEKLREGDRFTYGPKRLDVWQVMLKNGKHIEVNQPLPNGKSALKFNEKVNPKKTVMFLRHTKPMPGEECFIEDIESGDIFYKQDDIITEYVALGKMFSMPGMFGLRKVTDKEGKDTQMTHGLSSVVFVRKGKEVAP